MEENQQLLNEELFCPKCGGVPEFLTIHTSNSKVELKCKNCGVNEKLIDKYYEELKNSQYSKIKCLNCFVNYNINENIYYCYECKAHFCEKCSNIHSGQKHHYIKFNEKKYYCLKHFNEELKYFCLDDQENICEQELESLHKDHNIKKISDLKNLVEIYRNRIEKTNKELAKIIRFNNLILKTVKVSKNNYFHLKSTINLANSLEKGDKIDSKDIRCLFKDLSKDIQISNEAIKAFQNENKNIPLLRKDKILYLNAKELGDIDFRYISQVRFNQLKEIDISENNLTSIKPFNKMSLPFLEFLNLSHNKIKDIEPLSKLKCESLQYIFLQANEIEDLGAILETEFSSLNLLRVENNNIIFKDKEDEKIIRKKYSGKLIDISIKDQIKQFKEKYNLEIYEMKEDDSDKSLKKNPNEKKIKNFVLQAKNSNNQIKSENEEDIENIVKIDLSDLNKGDEMLEKLFLIITYKSKNRINTLILRNNQIENPLILNRINFNNLRILDLSVNEIKDLKFLSNLKAEFLKYLYLDNNNFNDVYPIYNAKLDNLELISLNKNQIESDENELIPGYNDLKNKNNKMIIQLKNPYKEGINNRVENERI